jgi:uncharacterized membrane protein YphA (DoxX/SURF4 family)
MYETTVGAGIPFPHVMTYFVSSVEFVCGCLLIVGLLSTLCCIAFIIDMIVAITTVQLATITKALSFIDWLDDFLYLPEVIYIIVFLWLISSGPERLSVDHWIAVSSGLLDGVSADFSLAILLIRAGSGRARASATAGTIDGDSASGSSCNAALGCPRPSPDKCDWPPSDIPLILPILAALIQRDLFGRARYG